MRLDVALVQRGFFDTRAKSAQAVRRGEVFVGGKACYKPAHSVSSDDELTVTAAKTFVSLGGYKLDKAFCDLDLDCEGKTYIDLGASTGGFTDVLLQRGAKKVCAVDVGEGLLDKKLASDPRVTDMCGVNARYLKREDFPEPFDGVVVDCSFISLKLILPAAMSLVKSDGQIIALIKPQFECGEDKLGKSGVLIGENKQKTVVSDICRFCHDSGLTVAGFTFAPIDKRKNIEYLLLLRFGGVRLSDEAIASVVSTACKERREL